MIYRCPLCMTLYVVIRVPDPIGRWKVAARTYEPVMMPDGSVGYMDPLVLDQASVEPLCHDAVCVISPTRGALELALYGMN